METASEVEEDEYMKTILLAALLLCSAPAFGQSGGEKLPLAKRVSAEKLILAEKYRNALENCRERTRKKAKESCVEQKKKEFGKTFADLEQDPRAYFAEQEKNTLDEKALQDMNRPRPRQ